MAAMSGATAWLRFKGEMGSCCSTRYKSRSCSRLACNTAPFKPFKLSKRAGLPYLCCISSGGGHGQSGMAVRRVMNSGESSCAELEKNRGFWGCHIQPVRSRVSLASKKRKCECVAGLWSRASLGEPGTASEALERVGQLDSIADFTRFRDNGDEGVELQTAIISYRKPLPWSIFQAQQVDLVAAVHIADREYFSSLQKELGTYDRVLYEMVADKNKMQTNRLGKMRWRPPRRLPGRRGSHGFSIIGMIQRVMAQLLTLEFQLECLDYRRDNWYHADLDFDTFQDLQRERGESFFSFARDLTAFSSKAITRATLAPTGLDPWRAKLFWISRVMPMPLLGLFVIEGVCAPSHSPLKKSPEMKALLDLDLAGAFKVFLAKQITTDLTVGASSLVENSVIIGERNRVAMDELQEALREGCHKVAIFYGSGHLPDMDRRLRQQFGLEPTGIHWRTAWLIKARKFNPAGNLSAFLHSLAEISGWPLNRYQTLSLLLLSAVLAVDLWCWEIFLNAANEYIEQALVAIVSFLDKGWNL